MQQDLEALGHIDKLVLFNIGKTAVTTGGLIAALLTFVVALVAARLIGLAMQRVRARATRGGAGLYIVEKLSTYGLLVFGAIAGVSTLGIDLSSLAVFGGALGVGVGLGLQGVVKEFVSGIVLIFDESLRVGDYIELESGQRGVIHEIGARATRIRNNDSVDILIPNSQLIQGTVTNWTCADTPGASASRSGRPTGSTRRRCATRCWRRPRPCRSPCPTAPPIAPRSGWSASGSRL